RTIAGGWIGEADQLLAQHGVDRGALFRRSHTRALQNVLVDRDGEISHGISVTRDQCEAFAPTRNAGSPVAAGASALRRSSGCYDCVVHPVCDTRSMP